MMEYTGIRTIDNIRMETERLARKTLDARLVSIMKSVGISESEFENIASTYQEIGGALRQRDPVQNSIDEILQLTVCIIANQEKRIQELERAQLTLDL